MSISEDIKDKRKKLGLTQKDFADALGLGKFGDRTLRRWENGECSPSPLEYQAIMSFADKIPFEQNSEENIRFKFIDLFAGIGGIRIPFQESGGECVFTSEWDKFAQKTYRVNFGDEPAGDITQIKTEDIPNFDILLGGFPCQPFSQAGLHKGFLDTRGTLFFEIERIIQEKKKSGNAPKAFLLENVKQLKGHDKGRTFKVIMDHLHALNYYATAKVLRAADFGVPQNRERIYIVGFDKDYFDISDDYEFIYPESLGIPTRLGDILEHNVDEKYTISDKLYAGHLRRKEEHKKKGNGFGFSLFNEDSVYTSTISARYYKDGSEILIDQGEDNNPRKLTPRECARLQGFPAEFIIPVSDTQAYKQFGNSVAVPVVRAVANRMLEEMDNFKILSPNKKGLQLEKRVLDAFIRAGWDCELESARSQFDITLTKDGKEYGYVETYICKNPRAMKNKIERIKKYLEEVKPKIFILTDGISFENYFDGEYFSTTTIPVGYFEYSQRNRLMAYYNMFKEMQNGKKGD